MSWSTSELRVSLAPWNRYTPSSKIFYWQFQGGTSFVDLLCFLSCDCYAFVGVCLFVPCGHLLGKGWPLGSRLWCITVVCHFPIGILGQEWYLIVSIPDLCTLTYFVLILSVRVHNFSVSNWVEAVLSRGYCVQLKDTMQCPRQSLSCLPVLGYSNNQSSNCEKQLRFWLQRGAKLARNSFEGIWKQWQ